MIVGYHVIFSMYGFWLPNDPRGSWSDFVGAWELFRAAGGATKTNATRSVAHAQHDRNRRLETKTALARPPVRIDGIQARAVGWGFAEYLEKAGCPAWACAILPDHVHLVLGRPRITIENVVIQLKGAATKMLTEQGIHPCAGLARGSQRPPKCFARGEWSVYLDPPDVARAVKYVEDNPMKEGKPPQRWKFVAGHPY